MITQSPLALYIHIPWCEKKCPYCDFNSHLSRSTVNEQAYIDALLDDLNKDIIGYADHINQRPISSIFIGGGTPSLFSASSFAYLLDGVKKRIPFTDNIEITSEANPGSSEANKFAGFREAGINRLSIGIQSFNGAHLSSLGRIHNSDEAINAANFAKQAGFDNLNLDIMFGLPQQTVEQALHDVQQAIELAPTHLSCYQLTIEPNTLFHHSPPITPNDETLWEMQQTIQTELATHGYQQYEVSAYARHKKHCQHNVNYWQYGDYLGIGAGAHSKLSHPDGRITRLWKIKHPANYLKPEKDFVGGIDQINSTQIPFEFMMNALRLRAGFNTQLFEQRTGLNFNSISPIIEKHHSLGLIKIENNHVQPTARGRQLLDSLLQDYLTEH